jgi:uncharacterized protein (DUF983 family)
LFEGWVRFAHKCRNCGLDLDSFNVGDGPAAFLIFIVGAITVVAALIAAAVASAHLAHAGNTLAKAG